MRIEVGMAVMTPAEADELLLGVILEDESRQDPSAAYAALHASIPRWESGFGFTTVASYADCLEVLRSPRWGRAEPDMERGRRLNGDVPRRDNRNSRTMLLLNPPDHTRIRALVSREFTPRRVESLRGRIQQLLGPMLDELESSGGGDVMTSLAVPFPVAVISELLGVPQQTERDFLQLVRDITSLIDAAADDASTDRGIASAAALGEYFLDLVGKRRASPDEGLLSALISVESEGDSLSLEELISNVILLYAAGFETTSNLIGNGLLALLENPEQMRVLRADRSLLPSAIWEMLRFDSPVQLNARFALAETPLFGEVVPRGTEVVILQGAANHDPLVYDEPSRFIVDRFVSESAATPLSFGWGAHHCLGAHLARAEGEIVFGALLDRFDRIELRGERPRFRPSFTLRGLESLDVEVSRSA